MLYIRSVGSVGPRLVFYPGPIKVLCSQYHLVGVTCWEPSFVHEGRRYDYSSKGFASFGSVQTVHVGCTDHSMTHCHMHSIMTTAAQSAQHIELMLVECWVTFQDAS